jgi:hypothetical protein
MERHAGQGRLRSAKVNPSIEIPHMARNDSKDKKLRPNSAASAKSSTKKDAKPSVTEKSAKPSAASKAAPPKNGKSGAAGKPAAAKPVAMGKPIAGKPAKEAEKGKKEPERSAKDAKGAVGKGMGGKSAAEGAKGAKSKEGAAAKPKDAPPKRKRKSSVVRLKAYWGVFNQMLKRVAVFEYAERKQADKKASELSTNAKQPHFVQLVKEVIRDED